MRFLAMACDADNLSPATLAFVGDGVYELLTREFLACEANRPAKELNIEKVKMVSAPAQADGFKKIEAMLTEKELEVFKRGRNAHTSRAPKNATHAQYHYATGLEALFGWLYLKGEHHRAVELFHIIFSDENLDNPNRI
ncbi:MAG: ribonuclease III [Clostridia bacterium]|nr:ribonuclease III [Clostridia bacterium]